MKKNVRGPFTFSLVGDIIQECSHRNVMIGWMPTSEDVRRASTLQSNFSQSLILPQKQTSSDMKKKKILLISLSTLFCIALLLGMLLPPPILGMLPPLVKFLRPWAINV